MSTITLTANGTTTTVRPIARTTHDGRRYLTVSSRAFKAAVARISYAGSDGVNVGHIDRAPGYGGWTQTEAGGLIAWELNNA